MTYQSWVHQAGIVGFITLQSKSAPSKMTLHDSSERVKVCVCICMYVCTCKRAYTYINTHTHTYIHTYILIHTHTYTYVTYRSRARKCAAISTWCAWREKIFPPYHIWSEKVLPPVSALGRRLSNEKRDQKSREM